MLDSQDFDGKTKHLTEKNVWGSDIAPGTFELSKF